MPELDIKDSYVRDAIWFLAFMRRKRKKKKTRQAKVEEASANHAKVQQESQGRS